MNSTYLELVDGLYANRGGMSLIGLFGAGLLSIFLFAMWWSTLFDFYLNPNWNHSDENAMLLSMGLVTVVSSLFILGVVLFNRKIGEWFGYTHYPIRLNRRNRMVYVFRGDGTVLEASWDAVYFTLHVAKKVAGTSWLGISGLVLKDPQTVEEAFMFGYSSSNRSYCLRHWEFMRRYMEEGPQSVINAPGLRYCLPIADKRETLYQGWIELVSNDAWNPIVKWLMLPFHVLMFLGRLVWRATSKVPLWPADVEAACRIAPGDAYVRDSSTNPAEYR
ncbi:DUF6708 domain-containing protein [Paraburkholderia sediminicola]|nr:DUF6708 domain-containing protein [Paraburkholderia sediminicola]